MGRIGTSLFFFLTSLFALELVHWNVVEAQEVQNELNIKYYALTSGRLAFTYTKDSQRDIYVIDFKTLTVSPLVATDAIDEYPSWSPDGQRLVFYSDVSGDREIYTINADGTNKQRLTHSKGIDEDPDWSADGKFIVFQSARKGLGTALYVMNEDGTQQKPLPIKKKKSTGINSVPKWSPRGSEIIYSTNEFWPGWDIGYFHFGDREHKILTSGYQSFCRGSWHPSGGSFAFSYGAGNNIDIWKFQKGAVELTPMIERPGRDYDAVWLDDGERMFFVGETQAGEGDFQLFIWERKDNRIQQVTEAPGSIRHPTWTELPTIIQIEKEILEKANKGKKEE